jgi:hypothetical protein
MQASGSAMSAADKLFCLLICALRDFWGHAIQYTTLGAIIDALRSAVFIPSIGQQSIKALHSQKASCLIK